MVVLATVALSLASLLASPSASPNRVGREWNPPPGSAGIAVYSISVAPLVPTSSTQQSSSGTANYTVSNTSTGTSQPLTISFAVIGCTGSINGCSMQQPITLSPGQSATVWVTFNGGYPTSSPQPLVLSASSTAPDATSPTSSAIVGVSVTPQAPPVYAISVTPTPATSSTPAGTSSTATWIVRNASTGTPPNSTMLITFALGGCPSPTISCGQALPPISLTPGGAQLISIAYTGMQPTSSPVALTLTASAGPTTSSAVVSVSVTGPPGGPTYAISVTAAPGTSSAQMGSQGTATYAIQNTSTNTTGPLQINFGVSGCSGSISCMMPPNPITLMQGGSQNVSVAYNAMQITSTPVALALTASTVSPSGPLSRSDTVRVSVTGPPPPPPFVYAGAPTFSPVTIAHAGSGLMSFSVANNAPTAQTVVYSVNCGGVGTCSAWPAKQTLAANASSTGWIYFAAGPTQYGTYTIGLTASGPGGSASASGQVIVQGSPPVYAISVTPNPSTATTPLGSMGFASYTIRNTSTNSTIALPISFVLSGCTSNIAPCGTAPGTITLAQGASQGVSLSFYGAAVTSSAALSLTGSTAYTSPSTGTVIVSVTQPAPVYAITVTPNPSTSSTPQGTSSIAYYTVTNSSANSTIPLSVSFSVGGCTGYIVSCPTPASITLAQGASQGVQVGYYGAIETPAPVALSLTASTSYTSPGTQSVNVTVTPPVTPATVIAAVPAGPFPGGAITRGACLTISAGESAAYECGALRVVHALPSMSTYGKARTPTLLFNGNHAAPGAILAVDVAVTGPQPTSIEATLKLGGRTLSRTFAWNAAWTDGQKRRMSIPVDAVALTLTNGGNAVVLADTLELKAYANGSVTAQSTVYGSVAIVDRRTSPFGAGWWLDGLEQFVGVPANANQKLWIGGDGSTRVYTRQGASNYWLVTPAIARPDTLEFVVSTSTWLRHLPNGASVEFDNSGQHTRTRDALGRFTTFNYSTSFGRTVLQSVQLPVPAGAIVPAYTFAYASDNAGMPRLSTVTAPPSNVVRVATVSAGTGPVASIRDADGSTTYFVSSGPSMTRRINKLGDTTTFAYDEAGLLRSVSLDMRRTGGTSALPITSTFCAAESRSATSCGGGAINTPLLSTKTYTLWDGPRTDVSDTTSFFINQFGAPDTVVNALGLRTRIKRNGTFALLADTVIAANGLKTAATYNARGLPDLVRVIDPLGANSGNADTRYTWDAKWDKVIATTSPTGRVTTFSYDPATGNQQWQRPGNNVARQVTFSYYATNQLASVASPLTNPESLYYDILGNLRASRSGLGFFSLSYRDALGRDTLDITPIDAAAAQDTVQLKSAGTRARTIYNIADRPDSVIRSGPARPYNLTYPQFWPEPVTADTLVTRNGYDLEGRLLSVVSYATPDNAQSDIRVSETYGYDAAGRTITHSRNGKVERRAYDAAGNDTSFTPATGGSVSSVYDVANRIASRSISARAYPQQHCTGLVTGQLTDAINPAGCLVVFPAYPNDASNGYTIPAEQATFTYDTLGGVLTANNGDAKVSRQYFRNGALRRDSVSHRAAIGSGFNYSFALNYDYDLEGRRKTLQLPSGDVLTYVYHSELGALARITDPRGNRYRYSYDLAGRIDSAVVGTATVDGLLEARRYDAEGRLFAHVRSSPVLGNIYTDSLTFDALGRVIRAASGTRANLSPPDTTYFHYSGLGAVLSRERKDGSASHWESEEFRVDAFGNVLTSRAGNSDFGGVGDPRISNYARVSGVARGLMTSRATSGAPQWEREQLTQAADADGNIERSQDQIQQVPSNIYTLDTPTHQYYSAAGQLRAVQRYRLVATGSVNGVFEEYRYDALGRRVLVIARHGTPLASLCTPAIFCSTLCNTGCVESVTRAVWDGDAIVHEERRPYPDGALNPPQFNIVEYVHGAETDRPFATLDTRLSSLTRALSWTWRGLPESSTTADGLAADCSLGGGGCDKIAWLDGHAIYSRPTPTATDAAGQVYLWGGSLLQDQQDKTGQHFRRNRYYDTQSGRFTQEDPIGLAGGANLYGFAGGDPVNYADPFGLCPGPLVIVCVWALNALPSATIIAAEATTGLAIGGAVSGRLTGTALRNAGRVGEAAVEAGLLRDGYTILGKQVGARTSAGLRFIDFLTESPAGEMVAIEAKSGGAVRNAGQLLKDGKMATEGAKLVGKNVPEALRDATVVVRTEERRP